ncbi:unnamed protein product [Mesocestoides corti]|uniref:EF-hand domain-containing protein n=1 Tax=Mesocestoides corti TaxID=53468 RepID=A0A0R3UQU8_MESCO|nr:unnamed protein product [Mesocestoides corti]
MLAQFDGNRDGKLTLSELRHVGHDFSIPYGEFLKWTRTPTGEELTELPIDTVLECIKVFVTRQMKQVCLSFFAFNSKGMSPCLIYFVHLLSRSKGAQDLFKVADVDQSGKLSLSEIKRLVEVCDYDIDDEELQAIFRRADANNDGELDDNEFVELVKYFIENK